MLPRKRSKTDEGPAEATQDAGSVGARPESLVTIETQREFDVFAGRWEERVFVKMYVAARTSGLLAEISDRDWKTLCALATYMDSNGYCFPSQDALAKAIGCSRQMANERIGCLARFRFRDKPVLLVVRGERTENGRWSRNGYHVLPIANLAIFDEDRGRRDSAAPGSEISPDATTKKVGSGRPIPTVSRKLDTDGGKLTVSRKLDMAETATETGTVSTAVSSVTGPAQVDTNESQKDNDIELDDSKRAPSPNRSRNIGISPRERETIAWHVSNNADEFGDNAPLESSITRALNLYRRSGRSLDDFVVVLQESRRITKSRWATIRGERRPGRPKSVMRYYFAVLEDVLGIGNPADLNPAAE